jgi:lipopolysaccharide/colanic/teichoic acid biosynthesis glycosyltransferase
MGSTAAEINVVDTDNIGRPVRRRALRTLLPHFRSTTSFEPGVLPFPALHQPGFAAEHLTGIVTPKGNDHTTRLLNLTVAAILLFLAAPIFFLIALMIKLTSRGPVLYKQTRIGLDRRWNRESSHQDVRVRDLGGRPFTMYKFRTMVPDAEKDNKEVWATPQDQRVTPIGRFLRAARLDELPQLLNVLAGDMNIVGPRPERPTIFAELREEIPNYHLRQRVMPGITGWAQVNQSYDTCVSDVRRKVAYDLEYLGNRSVVRDLAIMARTIPIMLLCRFGW